MIFENPDTCNTINKKFYMKDKNFKTKDYEGDFFNVKDCQDIKNFDPDLVCAYYF